MTTSIQQYFYTKSSHPYNLWLDFQFRRPDLLLGLYLKGLRVYSALVQLFGAFFLIIPKTYLILAFLKTGLKDGNLKLLPTDFAKPFFLESVLPRPPLW